MEKNIHKYEFIQEGRKFLLIIEIYEDKARLTCIEINKIKPTLFRGDFSLSYLKTLSPIFNSFSNINEAQKIIIKTIEKQKIKIEFFENYVAVKLYIINENEDGQQYFDLKCNITREPIYNKVIILNTVTKETSSPTKVLPRKYINLPPKIEEKTKITFSPVKRLPDKHIYLPPTITTSPTRYTSFSEENYYNQETHYQNNTRTKKLRLSLSSEHILHNNRFRQNQVLKLSPITNISNLQPSSPKTEPKININLSPSFSFSPKREQIGYLNNGSPSKNIINYSATPSYRYYSQNNSLLNKSITEVKYDNNNKIIQLQNEINKIKEEFMILKIENNKLINENKQLINQNKILYEENNLLRNNNNLNLNENNEIMMLKKEIERLNKIIINLKEQKDKEFKEYKKIKDEEIFLLKTQINNLLNNKSLKKINNISLIKTKNEYSLGNQIFTVQDKKVKVIKGEIIKNKEELEFLTKQISKNKKKIIMKLIYKATVDSDKASAFHKKCDWVNSSLVLIKSGNNKRFGGYTSCSWKGNSIDKIDEKAFVFSLDKLKSYDIIPEEYAIGCYPLYGPVFLGCQIRIYDEAFKNGGSTFLKGSNYKTEEDYELTGGSRVFEVKEIEVYSIELQ